MAVFCWSLVIFVPAQVTQYTISMTNSLPCRASYSVSTVAKLPSLQFMSLLREQCSAKCFVSDTMLFDFEVCKQSILQANPPVAGVTMPPTQSTSNDSAVKATTHVSKNSTTYVHLLSTPKSLLFQSLRQILSNTTPPAPSARQDATHHAPLHPHHIIQVFRLRKGPRQRRPRPHLMRRLQRPTLLQLSVSESA